MNIEAPLAVMPHTFKQQLFAAAYLLQARNDPDDRFHFDP
jgi:hypothetical protein